MMQRKIVLENAMVRNIMFIVWLLSAQVLHDNFKYHTKSDRLKGRYHLNLISLTLKLFDFLYCLLQVNLKREKKSIL